VGIVTASLIVGACEGSEQPLGPTATLPQATTTTDPYALPAVIDEAYVNRVLAGLDQAVGDVVRLAVSTNSIPPEAIERLEAIYVNRGFLELKIKGLQENLQNREQFVANPGNQVSTVTQLLSVSERCVFAEIERDYSLVAATPAPEPKYQWIALERSDSSSESLNPTNWVYRYDGFAPGRQKPMDPCAS